MIENASATVIRSGKKKSETRVSDFCFSIKNRLVAFLLFGGTQATRANVIVRYLAVCFGCDFMDIGIKAAFCLFVRVADVVAGHSAFTANRTHSTHVFRPPDES